MYVCILCIYQSIHTFSTSPLDLDKFVMHDKLLVISIPPSPSNFLMGACGPIDIFVVISPTESVSHMHRPRYISVVLPYNKRPLKHPRHAHHQLEAPART